jgi:DNA-directed RNA polymerase II subunit RPB1
MTHFRDLVSRSSVLYDPDDAAPAADLGMLRLYERMRTTTAEASGCDARASPWLLRFEFDRMKMLDMQVTMLDLEAALVEFYDDVVACVLSDDNAEQLVCRLRLAAVPQGSTDLLTEIKALEQSIMDHVAVKGVARIAKAVLEKPETVLRYDPASDAFVKDDEWSIVTAGSNLLDVLGHPCVDPVRTITNDVHEVFKVLGIECARQVLIDEMRKVLSMASMEVDHRHLSLMADAMSNRGFFMSIDRHGINNRGELGPLAKCSFEQMTDMLIKAGVFAEKDQINGVSANIMLGQVAPCGTGDCRVLMDHDRLVRDGRPVPVEDTLATPPSSRTARQQNNPQTQNQQRASSASAAASASGADVNEPLAIVPELDVDPARAVDDVDPGSSSDSGSESDTGMDRRGARRVPVDEDEIQIV